MDREWILIPALIYYDDQFPGSEDITFIQGCIRIKSKHRIRGVVIPGLKKLNILEQRHNSIK